MADVQVQQGGGGSAAWIWAIVALILVAIIAFLIFGGVFPQRKKIDVDVNVPAATSGPQGALELPSLWVVRAA